MGLEYSAVLGRERTGASVYTAVCQQTHRHEIGLLQNRRRHVIQPREPQLPFPGGTQKAAKPADFRHALDFGVRGEHVLVIRLNEGEIMIGQPRARIFRPAKQFIQGRKRGRDLQTAR